jgi:NDP-sugar pyrophosphorylase family protein
MKALLLCPEAPSELGWLAERAPLATVPLLGQSLLEYWLSHLACTGGRQVTVIAHDRAEQVRALAGDGARWGLAVNVIEESREFTSAQALLKYGPNLDPTTSPGSLVTLDHFPGKPEQPLFTTYHDWFAALQAWMPHAITPDRVGMIEVQRGVWVGLHSHVSPQARLLAPCWIGQNVFIGANAVIGPNSIVENGAFVEPGAEVQDSSIGPDTFLGRFAQLNRSIAWGSTLINWQTGSLTKVPDSFLLCAVRRPRRQRTAGWLARLSELYSRPKEELPMVAERLLLNKEG